MLAALGLGAILGARSGLVWQSARLVGVGAAAFMAVRFHEPAAEAAQSAFQGADPRMIHVLGYVLVFAAVYLALYLLTCVIYESIEATPLEPLDRLLGALLGAAKVGLFLAILSWAIVSAQHPKAQEIVERSVLAPALAEGLDAALLFLPPDWQEELHSGLENVKDLAAH
jgi:membrane protein required for colicin V production